MRWYALSYIAGLVFAVWYMRRLVADSALWNGKTPTATPQQVDDMFVWMTLGVVLGGRIGYVLFYNFAHFIADPMAIFRVWEGGMSFHGGFLGVVLAVFLYGKRIGASLDRLLDLGAASTPIGLGLGRLANFINGELYGRPTDVPWAMIFPATPLDCRATRANFTKPCLKASSCSSRSGSPLTGSRRLPIPAALRAIFALGYGLSRILVECSSASPIRSLAISCGFITMGMILSLPLVAIGIWLLSALAPHMSTALEASHRTHHPR